MVHISIKNKYRLNKKSHAHFINYFCLFSLCILALPVWAAVKPTITINDTTVNELINAQSLSNKKTEINLFNQDYVTEQFLQIYRWTLGLDAYNEEDHVKSASTFISPDSDRTVYSVFLDKKFITGTTFNVNYSRNNYESDVLSAKNSQNSVQFSLSQNVFPTLFSAKDYLSYKSVQLTYDKLALQNKLDQFEIQKNIVDLYWKIKAIQVSVAENDFLMKKYDNLVKTIQRRKRNSTANAGELEQALAEYELRKQSLLVDKQTLRKYLIDFKTELNIPQSQMLTIYPQNSSAQLPADFKGDIENLTRYKVQKLKSVSADADYSANKYNNYPTLDIYGEYNQNGVGADQSESYSQMNKGDQNKYKVGVKLNYYFNNKAADAE